MSKQLLMSFATSLGGTTQLSVDAPKDELNAAEVGNFMELIISKNIFDSNTGNLSVVKAAKVITTLTETLI
nr:DUF2922 domain-containing protein [Sedimentibacter sp.]